MTLSRRQFLQVFGISVGGLSLTQANLTWFIPDNLSSPAIVQGRTLVQTTIITESGFNRLWANTVIPIYGIQNDHYITDTGSILRRKVQPMYPHLPFDVNIPTQTPFEAEVASPTAIIHQYADITAPLITQIGHGGIMTVVDKLENTQTGWWYQVSNNNQIHGWTQGLHWRELKIQKPAKNNPYLTINRAQKKLTLSEGQQLIMETDISLPHNISGGNFNGWKRNLSENVISIEDQSLHGVPYHFATSIPEAPQLHSAYWHNNFGDNHHLPTIELNVISGKYLFNNLNDEFSINVI